MQNKGLLRCVALSCCLMGVLLVMAQFSPIYASQTTPDTVHQEGSTLLELPTANVPPSINAPEAPTASTAIPVPILPPADAPVPAIDAKEKSLPLPTTTTLGAQTNTPIALPSQPMQSDVNTAGTVGATADKTVKISPPKIITVPGVTTLELLEEPLRFDEGLSLMFSEKDMYSLVIPSLALFDKVGNQAEKNSNNQTTATDDLTGLLESLKGKGETKEAAPPPLPNIYLGSIVYYSDANWSIWLNGKKITNAYNSVTNPLYVQSISRSQVELVWRPASMIALNKAINERKNASLDHLIVDNTKGLITVTLKPNQTFVPSLLVVLEGLVKQAEPAVLPESAAATEGSAADPQNAKFSSKK